jgi:hypothetical protein
MIARIRTLRVGFSAPIVVISNARGQGSDAGRQFADLEVGFMLCQQGGANWGLASWQQVISRAVIFCETFRYELKGRPTWM